MTDRRKFIGGVLAAALTPIPSRAEADGPAYLSAAKTPSGSYVLCGIGSQGNVVFQIPLPDRGHAAAAHPTRPHAVAFARRPGTFAVVIDCALGNLHIQIAAPDGRHFYGHGVFSRNGRWLYTTENDYETGQGRIGVWDADNRYKREGEVSSGGIGPHDIKRLPGNDILVVANGGIDTHADTGRAKLNLPTMAPNISYIDGGNIVERAQLRPSLHKNSIRHLSVSNSGQVAIGMQWQGEQDAPSLAGLHRRGAQITLTQSPKDQLRRMQGYVGSISFTHDQKHIAVTSPRGNILQVFDAVSGVHKNSFEISDASGVAASDTGVMVTSGTGHIYQADGEALSNSQALNFMWDNHLVPT